jgi:hypothetical protein
MKIHVRHSARRGKHALLALAMSVAMSACGSADVFAPGDGQASSLSLTLSGAPLLSSLGDSALLNPKVLDASGNMLSTRNVRWSMRPTGIVVQEGSAFRAVKNGRVTIVAEIELGMTGVRPDGYWAGRVADSVTIDVQQRAVRLSLAPVDTAFTTLGAVRKLQVTATDARGNTLLGSLPALTWSSSQPGAATVDSAGVVKSMAEGLSVVTVQAVGLFGAVTFTVRPRLPHTSCMVFAQRRQSKQSCVTVDFTIREREAGR